MISKTNEAPLQPIRSDGETGWPSTRRVSGWVHAWTSLLLLVVPVGTGCGAENGSQFAEIGKGFSYQNDRVTEKPWSIHYVKVDRNRRDFEIGTTLAHGTRIGLSVLTEQIRELPREMGRPLVAINGDFYRMERNASGYAGDPRGLAIVRGELVSSPSANPTFWVDPAGNPHVGEIEPRFEVIWPNGDKTPFAVNEERQATNAVLYTWAIGASTGARNGRELILESAGSGPWLPLRAGQLYSARVREVRTNSTRLSPDVIVLSLGPSLVSRLPEVEQGAVVKISTATVPDLAGVNAALGGGPVLVRDGKNIAPRRPANLSPTAPYPVKALYEPHPRSAIGFNKTHYFFVEVDGRQPGLSIGMTLVELGDYLVKLGCETAMNLDGGNSSELWVRGQIMNSPSNAQMERPTATGLVLLQKPRGENR